MPKVHCSRDIRDLELMSRTHFGGRWWPAKERLSESHLYLEEAVGVWLLCDEGQSVQGTALGPEDCSLGGCHRRTIGPALINQAFRHLHVSSVD